MAQCINPPVIAVNRRSISPRQRSFSLTRVQACPSPSTPLANSRVCKSNTPARGCQDQWPDCTKPAGQGASIEAYATRPIAGEGSGMAPPGLMPRRPCAPQHSGVPNPGKSFGQMDAIRSFGQCQNLSVPMFSVGPRHVEPGQPKEEQPEKPFSSLRNTLTLERQQEVGFRSLGLENSLPAGLSPEKHANPERTRLKIRAHELVQSSEVFEKKVDPGTLSVASRVHQEYNDYSRAAPVAHVAIPVVRSLGSPGQQSVYPSDDGSTSEKHKHCSTIPSDHESLTTDQLRAYKELEQAEMACALKRAENCLAEERERSASLQTMFATELMAQKDAHTRDVASLEDMVTKVLAENQRLSNMVEGLCAQVGQRERAPCGPQSPTPSSTCPSSNASRSKRSPNQSGSSEEGSPSSLDSKHKSTILHRAHALSKDRMANSSSSSPQPASSEAEHTTDSELTPSSDETSQPPKPVWTPKPKTYICID